MLRNQHDRRFELEEKINGQNAVTATWPNRRNYSDRPCALLFRLTAGLLNISLTDATQLESILRLWFVLGAPGICLASSMDAEPSPSLIGPEEQVNGNPSAAADLYGTGIRIGFYMQSIGMLMSLVGARPPNFKFAAATSTLAVLLS